MKFKLHRVLALLLITLPLFFNSECKKQPRCGCGGDVIFTLNDSQVLVQYNESGTNIMFSNPYNPMATYYFCNPSKWIDTIKKMNTKEYLLLSGEVYYECNYMYMSGNYYTYTPPVYQVMVTSVREDNYGKK